MTELPDEAADQFLFAAASVVLHNPLSAGIVGRRASFYSQQRVSCCRTRRSLRLATRDVVSIRSSECRAAEPARQKAHSRRRAVSIRSSECRAAEHLYADEDTWDWEAQWFLFAAASVVLQNQDYEAAAQSGAPSFYSQQQVSCCRTRTMRLPLKVARLVSIRSSECRAAQQGAELARLFGGVSIRSSECRAAQPKWSKPGHVHSTVSIRSSECRAAQLAEYVLYQMIGGRFYSQQRVSCCTTWAVEPGKIVRHVSIRSSECRAAQPVSCTTETVVSASFYSQQRVSCCTTAPPGGDHRPGTVSIRSSECRAAQHDYRKTCPNCHGVSIRSSECRAAQPCRNGHERPARISFCSQQRVSCCTTSHDSINQSASEVSIRSSECRAAQPSTTTTEYSQLTRFYSQQRVSCCTTAVNVFFNFANMFLFAAASVVLHNGREDV